MFAEVPARPRTSKGRGGSDSPSIMIVPLGASIQVSRRRATWCSRGIVIASEFNSHPFGSSKETTGERLWLVDDDGAYPSHVRDATSYLVALTCPSWLARQQLIAGRTYQITGVVRELTNDNHRRIVMIFFPIHTFATKPFHRDRPRTAHVPMSQIIAQRTFDAGRLVSQQCFNSLQM